MKEQCRISVIIITRNEARRIRACLESLGWADEIIVVDQNSTDGTDEICRNFGARVISREMSRGFGDQKNFALAQASFPWVLSLDADEVVTPELRYSIIQALKTNAIFAGYRMPRLTNYLGQFIRRCGWYPASVLRLFRKDTGRFTDALVHEEVVVNGDVGLLTGDLLHFSYEKLSDHIRKMDLYTTYDAEMISRKGVQLNRKNMAYYFFLKPILVFLKKYFLQKGYMEGVNGFILAVMAGIVTFCSYVKLWELKHSPDSSGAVHGR
jgi:glycosyltransferase involved in cell wall biosynthesis